MKRPAVSPPRRTRQGKTLNLKKKNRSSEPIRRGRKPLLPFLDIELTERCDNDCIHCCINLPENDPRAKKKELSAAQWKDILTQAADLGILTVRFTGGEPLLREDFPELYLHARRLGLKVMLFTNARNLGPELTDLFVRIPPLEKIEISVYGMSRKTYEAVSRKPGSYAEFRRGVDLLSKNRIPFIVKGALLPANKNEISEFETWAATIPWMDSPPSYSMTFSLRDRRDSQEKNRLIRTLRVTPEEAVRILHRRGAAYRKEMILFCRKFIGPPGKKLFTCGAGQSGCVDAYGRLQPCLSLRAPGLCHDLKKASLEDILLKEFPKLSQVVAGHRDYLARCARCFLKGLCEQCPAKSWSEHGSLETPVEYLCQVAHEQARDLGLLHQGEKAWRVKNWRQRIENMED